jgi:hypothetical protein
MAAILESKTDFKIAAIIPWEKKTTMHAHINRGADGAAS